MTETVIICSQPLSKTQDILFFGNNDWLRAVGREIESQSGKAIIGHVPIPSPPPSCVGGSGETEIDGSTTYASVTDLHRHLAKGAAVLFSASDLFEIYELLGADSFINHFHNFTIIRKVSRPLGKNVSWSDPDMIHFHHRIESCRVKDPAQALEICRLYIAICIHDAGFRFPNDPEEVANTPLFGIRKHIISELLLCCGILPSGYYFHICAFNFAFQKHMNSELEYVTDLQRLQNFRVMLRRTPGPGDELYFSSVFNDLLDSSCEIIVEVDERLHSLFERSFPGCEIRARANDENAIGPDPQVDFHAGFSAPLPFFRRDISDYPRESHHLVADPERRRNWRADLKQRFPGQRVVGFAWKSQSQYNNNLYGVDIAHWKTLFSTPDVAVINLQYGDIEDDRRVVRDRFGATLHVLPELDVMNDFEGVAALMAELDAVVAVASTPGFLAGAVGARTLVLGPTFFPWLLGTDHMPLIPRIEWFLWDHGFPRSRAVERAITALAHELSQR